MTKLTLCVFHLCYISLLVACGSTPNTKTHHTKPAYIPPAPQSAWHLNFPNNDLISFQGTIETDRTSHLRGEIFYPAPSAGGFLAGVLTHALINSGMNSSEEKKRQDAANKVLERYKGELTTITPSYLVESLQLKSRKFHLYNESAEAQNNIWVLNVDPNYFLSQDESHVALHLSGNLQAKLKPNESVKNTSVIYLSEFNKGPYNQSFQPTDEKLNLKKLAKDMFKSAIQLLESSETLLATTSEQQTIRYKLGNSHKSERGFLIERNCNRITFKNLHGLIKSVPLNESSETCANIDNMKRQS